MFSLQLLLFGSAPFSCVIQKTGRGWASACSASGGQMPQTGRQVGRCPGLAQQQVLSVRPSPPTGLLAWGSAVVGGDHGNQPSTRKLTRATICSNILVHTLNNKLINVDPVNPISNPPVMSATSC